MESCIYEGVQHDDFMYIYISEMTAVELIIVRSSQLLVWWGRNLLSEHVQYSTQCE